MRKSQNIGIMSKIPNRRILKKTIISIVIVLVIGLSISCSILAFVESDSEQYNSKLEEIIDYLNPFTVGKVTKDKLNKDTDVIVGYINNQPIYKNEIEFLKFSNRMDYELRKANGLNDEQAEKRLNLTDDEMIAEIAKNKLMIIDANSRGIVISQEQVAKVIKDGKINTQIMIEKNNAEAIKNAKDRGEFLKGLGITQEEYEKTLLSDKIHNSLVYYEYAKNIYDQLLKEDKSITFSDEMVSDFLNEILLKSDFVILK